MKKFLILMSAGVGFAFASCSTSKSGSCCGACQASATECAACVKEGKTCAACAAKKN
ncbi:hypothetical protein V2O64_16455 [Verrucomicrobiaceae bacterium 227]